MFKYIFQMCISSKESKDNGLQLGLFNIPLVISPLYLLISHK